MHDLCLMLFDNRIGHCKQCIHTVDKRCSRAKCHKRIHVWCPVYKSLESIYEELLVYDHNRNREQKLYKSHRYVIALEERRQRPVPHHMSHRHIHERDQQNHRRDQAFPHQRCLRIFQCIFLICRTAGLLSGFHLRCFIAGFFDRPDDRRCICRSFHAHRIGKQAHGTICHAIHRRNCFLDTRAAGGAAHTLHFILFHVILLSYELYGITNLRRHALARFSTQWY